jgi:cytoskeletal protein CcmA (bactofilin family)
MPNAPEGTRPTEITALLGRGTTFEGKLHFFGRVRIDGHFVGDIRGDDVLVIGEGARVEGTIEVTTCIVTAGEVIADVRAREAIELYAPAKVKGSLHAPAVFIDRGVVFEGTCTMAPLEPTRPIPPSPTLAMEVESLAPPTSASPTATGGDEEAP